MTKTQIKKQERERIFKKLLEKYRKQVWPDSRTQEATIQAETKNLDETRANLALSAFSQKANASIRPLIAPRSGRAPLSLASLRGAYSISEAAQVLSLSIKTVERLVKDNAIPIKRVGKRVLIPKRSLEIWLTLK